MNRHHGGRRLQQIHQHEVTRPRSTFYIGRVDKIDKMLELGNAKKLQLSIKGTKLASKAIRIFCRGALRHPDRSDKTHHCRAQTSACQWSQADSRPRGQNSTSFILGIHCNLLAIKIQPRYPNRIWLFIH